MLQTRLSTAGHDVKTKDILYQVLGEVQREIPVGVDFSNEKTPSMTFVISRDLGVDFEFSVIGDCVLYVFTKQDDIVRFSDERVNQFSRKTIEVQSISKNSSNARELITSQRLENRKFMNKDDGYWVATIESDWIHEVKRLSIKKSEISSILMCSDGFDRLFSLFQAIPVAKILRGSVDLTSCMRTLRNLEEDDGQLKNYPRMKVSDDSSAILLTN